MERTFGTPEERSSVPGGGADGAGTTGGSGAAGGPAADPIDTVRHSLVKGATNSGPARITRLLSGDYLLTVNPVDGSEIEARRPDTETPGDARRDARSRAAIRRAAQPPVPSGPPAPILPLLEREEERERLVRLLSRGRSVRLTGPAGSGRSALLDAVADACADLAPDGVVRLSGHRQSPTELLYALHHAVYDAPGYRPDRAELLERVAGIGAVVVLDDLECGGEALDELLRATPECAFLLAATPDTPAPSEDSHLEEIFLGGLGRTACAVLLAAAVGRKLTDEETAWAGDLWFASEGLPLRFVQAGALLRQRDELMGVVPDPAADAVADAVPGSDIDAEEPGVFEKRAPAVKLPALAESAAPAALLASRLGESAREALRFAVALGGELPHQAHLPALVGDTHADTAVGELLACGLITAAGPRYRLASGVQRQLEEAGYGDEAAAHALTAAQHYAWWTGHPSVAPERAAAEADAVLAALAALVAATPEDGRPSAAVLLARTAAPAFAGGLHWSAWERVLRAGQEAARIAGEVAEEAYFHHELGILALCGGRLDRARAELEASIGLRGALADKRGMVAGRRALALVADRTGGPLSPPLMLAAPPVGPASDARTEVLPPVRGGLPEIDLELEAEPVVKDAFPTLAPPRGDVTATPPVPLPSVSGRGPVPLGADGRGFPGAAGGAGPAGPAAGATGPTGVAGVRGGTPASGHQYSPTDVTTSFAAAGLRAGAARPGGSRGGAGGRVAGLFSGARRNVVAAAAGAVLVAVLGTAVTLGLSGGEQRTPGQGTRTEQSVTGGSGDPSATEDDTAPEDDATDSQEPAAPTMTDGPGSSDEPTPGVTGSATASASPSGGTRSPSTGPSPSHTRSTSPKPSDSATPPKPSESATPPKPSDDPTPPTKSPTQPTDPTGGNTSDGATGTSPSS
ncbi:ATP-binding protein [Streptomyces sp. NPDC093225]|uniref:ATP-binding protein n=1 Tax=Streptomyces sp. NPDC093225 TaxID=3366034 RepID=UPI0037F1133E